MDKKVADGGVRWDVAAEQFLSALRANRSQRELSRLLGYRSNVLCNWEAGRRFPSAARTLAICAELGIDAGAALARFASGWDGSPQGLRVGPWLNALRGSASVASLARRSGLSRHAIARWLRGSAQPRLPEFLRLVHAITLRVTELVDALIRLNDVPELADLGRELERERQEQVRRTDQRRRLTACRAELALRRLQNPRLGDWFESASVSGVHAERASALLRWVAAKIHRMAAHDQPVDCVRPRVIVNL